MILPELAFGFDLHLETGSSFFWKDDYNATGTNGRLRVLQLANEMYKSMLLSLRLVNMDMSNHENTQVRLEDRVTEALWFVHGFLKQKRFDSYYQLPWTFGKHMLCLLTVAARAGEALVNARGLVSAMFHAYNMARQVCPEQTRDLPLLETLCGIFGEQVFMGKGRPKEDFWTNAGRSAGGNLIPHSRGRREEKRHIDFSASLTKGAEDLLRIKVGDVSLFHYLTLRKNASLSPDATFWVRVFSDGGSKTPSKAQALATERRIASRPFSEALEHVKTAMAREFEGDTPVALFSYFTLYNFAVVMWTTLAEKYQAKMPSGMEVWAEKKFLFMEAPNPRAGFEFFTYLAYTVETPKGSRESEAALWHKYGVKLVWEALEKACGMNSLQDFFWQSA